jgi:arabinosaccharide transport system substrate-binding protein
LIAVVSTITVTVMSALDRKPEGLEFWTFAKNHGQLYQQIAKDFNRQAEAEGRLPVHFFTIDGPALQRRTLSGFWSGTPLADLIEVERNMMTQFVSGPLEDVGFVDLTDRIVAEGLDETINAPSFAPWSSRGRIFGLPHDVHPVLLCYRADLVEQAGIDVSQIETWDDFVRLMSPLIADLNGDGRPDRYLLNMWYTNMGEIEPLLLQAGGGTFDSDGESIIASEANAKVIAHVVAWCLGPTRIAIDAPEFSASGNQLKLEGKVVAQVMPDWLAGIWKQDLPQLGGKVKLMPLPAWEAGGRRTSVKGGTMVGIPKATEDFEAAWNVAKSLYLSPDLAEESFEVSNIISPVKSFWDAEFYRKPDPYFSGQASGSAYIDQAPYVPFRSSNPYGVQALVRITEAVSQLYAEAAAGRIVPVEAMSAEALIPRARELLGLAEARVLKEMSRNVFLREDAAADPNAGVKLDVPSPAENPPFGPDGEPIDE